MARARANEGSELQKRMNWTKQHPTQDGFYWYRDLPGAAPEILERASDVFWENGSDCMCGTEWNPLEGEFWPERLQPRDQIIFERALCLCANEYGKTRSEMLAWLNDDAEDWRTDYPLPAKISVPNPFIQVTRHTTVSYE